MRYNIRATFSPDSRFILAGSEDGKLYIWRSDNGLVVKRAWDVGLSGHIPCVDWSPSQRLICACAFSESQPIVILDYKLELDPRLASISVSIFKYLISLLIHPFFSLSLPMRDLLSSFLYACSSHSLLLFLILAAGPNSQSLVRHSVRVCRHGFQW